MIDFNKLKKNTNDIETDPRNIFMSLPSRSKRYEYPRDVQTEVWKKWYDIRNNNTCIIKMNTGSGKTVVGLMILKSCLNEGKGPAVYIVPDNYLVQQVFSEASNLGIEVTQDPDDISFLRKRKILVTNIHTLVNGKSKFGMRRQDNINIGSIIIDDVHACLDTIETQYCVSIPSNSSAYSELSELFSESLKYQSENNYFDMVNTYDPVVSMLVPFWVWQAKQREIYEILVKNIEEDYMKFSFPLIKNNLPLCDCVISASNIEITPPCIPINKISSFVNSERKIFMSATLADDSVFVTTLDIDSDNDINIISPDRANDIGDRLILFPQVMNKKISDAEVKSKIKELAKKYNVVVIVPSHYRADFWNDVSDLCINTNNINDGISKLKSEHVGLTVLVNKYDGVDLPDDACRILVIDGLPKMRSLYDGYEQYATPHNKRLCREQIQKIEQGMGRGVRSNTDYCTIVLMGRALADIIYTSDGYNYFSEATKAQYKLSEDIWDQLTNPNIDTIFELADYSLSRNVDWVTTSKAVLSNINYSITPNFSTTDIMKRKAFNLAEQYRYAEAVQMLEDEKNTITDNLLRGLFKQYIAKYVNFYNIEEAQQLQLSAYSDNRMALRPIAGIQFDKVLNKTGEQAEYFINNVTHKFKANDYIIRINSLVEQLTFSPDTAKSFENALKEISFLIGIFSNRPEAEYGKGPDNFWDIGNSEYLVIECKNGTVTKSISKSDCNQLNGSINWFSNNYHSYSCVCYPILIHNSTIFNYDCSPYETIRIMNPQMLNKFKENILKFAENVVKPDSYNNTVKINQLLNQFQLFGKQIVDNFTTPFTQLQK